MVLLVGLMTALAPPAPAQSIVAGTLQGEVVTGSGQPLLGTQITVENRTTGSFQTVSTDSKGRFELTQLIPGIYAILAEQLGYQPVRQGGVRVVPGQRTSIRLTLERRPPPITSVAEIPDPPRGLLSDAPLHGQVLDEREVRGLDWRRDISDLSRQSAMVSSPRDGRNGFIEAGGGLPQEDSRLLVDGFQELQIRHPSVPAEPATAPAFPRSVLDQARIISDVYDIEYPAAGGPLLSGYTRRGTNHFRFEPYVTWSGKTLGNSTKDNPADSSFNSVQAGAALSGALVRDTAQFFLAGDYQNLKRPSAFPWARDSASFGGAAVSLRSTLPAVASDSFGTSVGNYVNPVLRNWVGGRVFGRADWRISSTYSIMARFGLVKWKEDNPQLAQDLPSGFGARLDARDLSGALGLTAVWKSTSDELRLGLRTAGRDWSSTTLPATYLIAEAAGFGAAPSLPGSFKQRDIELTNTVHIATGRSFIKVIGGADFSRHSQEFRYGGQGIFHFGDLDSFGNGLGDFYQAFTVTPPSAINSKQVFLGLEGTYSLSPGSSLLAGLRFETQRPPKRSPIPLDSVWAKTAGLNNNFFPSKIKRVGPRAGFVWDPGDRHEWILRIGGGLFYEGLSAALLGEAVERLRVFRAQGIFSNWPTTPDTLTGSPYKASRLTIFHSPYKDPRTGKLELGLSRSLSGGMNLHLNGAYHHTDYLPRRVDLNRLLARTGVTQEGRPIYGSLVKQGGLVSPTPGSNRRFGIFDLVSGIEPTGFSSYYEVSLEVERHASMGLSYSAAYTYSRTRDNWPTGPTGDPADQLSPFPEDPIATEWLAGRSDFDIPHRGTVGAEYRFPGRLGVTVGARYRYRSGLPFTPGFQPGVDANGDGSGLNDPAFVDPALPGMQSVISANSCLSSQSGRFVNRNSCRDPAVHSLDLRVSVGLPIASLKDRVELTVDALNLIGTEVGIRDHALLLIDPAVTSPLITDPVGNVTLPLMANPRFGEMLSRRGENRLIRFGLRLGY